MASKEIHELLYNKDVAERDDVHFIDKDNGEMSMDYIRVTKDNLE